MKIKSNKLSRTKERAKENLKSALGSIAVFLSLFAIAYVLYYYKNHRYDDLMVKIQQKNYQLFDDTFSGAQNKKVHSYKVVKVDGIYIVELFNQNGSHSHYAKPGAISIIEIQ